MLLVVVCDIECPTYGTALNVMSINFPPSSYATLELVHWQPAESKCQSGTFRGFLTKCQNLYGYSTSASSTGVQVLSFSQMKTLAWHSKSIASPFPSLVPCNYLRQYALLVCLCLVLFRLLGLPDFARSLWGHQCSTLRTEYTKHKSNTILQRQALTGEAKHTVYTFLSPTVVHKHMPDDCSSSIVAPYMNMCCNTQCGVWPHLNTRVQRCLASQGK